MASLSFVYLSVLILSIQRKSEAEIRAIHPNILSPLRGEGRVRGRLLQAICLAIGIASPHFSVAVFPILAVVTDLLSLGPEA
jgi:hypothetical protein